jgi:hypothetical protein
MVEARAAREAPPSGEAELAALDGRTGVPLAPRMALHMRENMRDHLVVVQEVALALAEDDLDAVARAADRLGSSPVNAMMCSHMGAGAPGFAERGLGMHRSADGIAASAREGDRAATLRALGETLATCTGCHAEYRQEVLDPVAFEARTGSVAPAHGH